MAGSSNKPKTLLTATVTQEVADALKLRAKELNWAVAKTAACVLQNWYDSGCPPITDLVKRSGDANPEKKL